MEGAVVETLRAEACDSRFEAAIRARMTLRVLQVFDHAVNLEGGGWLWTVVARPGFAAPFTVCVAARGSLADSRIRPGSVARWQGEWLALSAGARIDFSSCRTVPTAGEEMAWDVAAARRGLAAFDEALAASGEARGCLLGYRRRWLGEACPLDAMSSFVWQRADDLMRVAFAGEGVEAAARRLVGAGQGLTPAGDDFIAGALCVLGGVDHPAARRVRQAVADGVGAPGVLDATTRVSRQMLACELAGQAASTHLRFQRALLRDACDAGPALSELLSVGHTSGADFAAGAADALRRLVLLTGVSGRRR